MRKTVYTHVTSKALRGIQRLAEIEGREVYLWPAPYKRRDGQDGWTVAVVRK